MGRARPPLSTGRPLSGLAYFLPENLVRGGRWYSGSKNFHRWAPGDAWMYSNVGAALAAHAVEGATGTRFKRYSHRKFFGPLGMDHSEWFLEDLRERDIEPAVPYTFDRDDRWKAVEHYGFPTWPDGQLRSTARDMGMLLRLVLGNGLVDGTRVVSPEAVDLLLSRPQGDLSEWYLSEFMLQQRVFWFDLALGDRTLTGHDGDDIGVSSEVFYDRTSGVGVALVMNLADGERDGEPRAATVAIQQRLFALGESL